ncbi:MAG TPA: hypothetical protein VE999_00605 [Gemmataceae bacterium]|nr:hypothetical protein [Gemmataceae bacterium]
MLRRSMLLLTGLVLGPALTIGCQKGPPPGPNLATPYPVQGQIKFPNGTPLRGGVVYFTPTEIKAGRKVRYEGACLVDAQGKYKIGFNGDGAGVPAGEYKVTFTPRELGELPNSNSGQIPKKYQEKSETPLIVTVEEQDNTFDFVLN